MFERSSFVGATAPVGHGLLGRVGGAFSLMVTSFNGYGKSKAFWLWSGRDQ